MQYFVLTSCVDCIVAICELLRLIISVAGKKLSVSDNQCVTFVLLLGAIGFRQGRAEGQHAGRRWGHFARLQGFRLQFAFHLRCFRHRLRCGNITDEYVSRMNIQIIYVYAANVDPGTIQPRPLT